MADRLRINVVRGELARPDFCFVIRIRRLLSLNHCFVTGHERGTLLRTSFFTYAALTRRGHRDPLCMSAFLRLDTDFDNGMPDNRCLRPHHPRSACRI